MKKLLAAMVAAFAGMVLAGPAVAATVSYEGAATNEGTHVKLVSDTSDTLTTNDFGNVLITDVGVKLGDLTTLSADYNATDDGCAPGSPRYQLHLEDGTIVHVAFGTFSSTTGTFTCATTNTWESTGNLVGQYEGCRWHSTGTVSDACLTAAELQALAGQTITTVRLVVDGSWALADKEQTALVRNLTINTQTFVPYTPPTTGRVNAAKYCKAERTRMGTAAFNELWGTNGNDRNAFGKCVSTTARAQNATARQAHRRIMSAAAACKARGLRGAALGACVAARDNVAATRTEAQERAKTRGKGKGRRP